MTELTPDDVRHWDPSLIQQMFQAAKGVDREHQKLGDNLDENHRHTNWHGESGDAFREELGKPRTDLDDDMKESKAVAAAPRRSRIPSRSQHRHQSIRKPLQRISATTSGRRWSVTAPTPCKRHLSKHAALLKVIDPELSPNVQTQLLEAVGDDLNIVQVADATHNQIGTENVRLGSAKVTSETATEALLDVCYTYTALAYSASSEPTKSPGASEMTVRLSSKTDKWYLHDLSNNHAVQGCEAPKA